MLPVYRATSVIDIISKGGHTQPWIVTVKTEDDDLPFVVKLFTTDQIETNNPVTAEVISNQLAKHFEFNVPEAALIEFDDFVFQRTPYQQSIINSRDSRIKFGTRLLEPAQLFTAGLPKNVFANRFPAGIDTLFAFDNFIRNSDRGRKPNLLFHDQDTWLIDHEKAFDSLEIVGTEMEQWKNQDFSQYLSRFYLYHISYPYLRATMKSKKDFLFEDFFFYLETLNLNLLTPFYYQLEDAGYDTKIHLLNNYLDLIKNNTVIFKSLLRYLIYK